MHDRNPRADLLAMIRGHRLTDSITTVARLGVPDLLAAGPADATTLAVATGTHAPTLYRLLRTLAAAGVLHEDADGRFSLTATGSYLASTTEGSVSSWVELIASPTMREAWANLDRSIRTGENTFTALHGESVWEWRGHEPGQEVVFNRAMAALTAGIGDAVAGAFDFGGASVVADIGGGSGLLLASILVRNPNLRGILFDQPAVVAAPEELERAGVVDRCEVVGGSFFDGVPAGADVYLMKAILHDWEDPESIAILRSIRREIPDDGTLLVVERVIGPPNEDLEGKLSDLHMLVMPGGRERTAPEWTELLAKGGFALTEIRPIAAAWQVIVARPTA
jgi:O-methyltransferase domain/IclR helix-turn-helix domain